VAYEPQAYKVTRDEITKFDFTPGQTRGGFLCEVRINLDLLILAREHGNAFSMEHVEVLRFRPPPLCRSHCACRLVLDEVLAFLGAGSLTPPRRAVERPMAIACLVDRAPCFPLEHDGFLRERILQSVSMEICLHVHLRAPLR
jgi:hypothetical protein